MKKNTLPTVFLPLYHQGLYEWTEAESGSNKRGA